MRGTKNARIGIFVLPLLILLTSCDRDSTKSAKAKNPPRDVPQFSLPGVGGAPAPAPPTLRQARANFKTNLKRQANAGEQVVQPPPDQFKLVKYAAAVGDLPAYLTPDPRDEQKHPAIVWITGGDCNTIGDVWTPAERKNDQTAAAYRKQGIVMMFPSLRGGNTNPGSIERFYGEVTDIVSAAAFLARQPYVHPDRIYLGGHSTGGTLTLLTAEYSDRFRAVICFGPVADPRAYRADEPFDTSNTQEFAVRAPFRWLASIKTPTFILEGDGRGNVDSLRLMRDLPHPDNVHFAVAAGATHFNVLAPTNELIARKILADTGPACNLSIEESELTGPFAK